MSWLPRSAIFTLDIGVSYALAGVESPQAKREAAARKRTAAYPRIIVTSSSAEAIRLTQLTFNPVKFEVVDAAGRVTVADPARTALRRVPWGRRPGSQAGYVSPRHRWRSFARVWLFR